MKRNPTILWCLTLAAALILSLAACGSTEEAAPAPEEPPAAAEPSDSVLYSNGGLTLSVPKDYDGLLLVDTPADSAEGVLFSATEQASKEWGEKLHPGEDWGDGWLFSIGRIGEAQLHELLCYDMSGVILFGEDGAGSYYVFYHPTDVRFVRESYEIDSDSEDWMQWAALNEWAWTVPESFLAENGLTACTRTNTSVDICLSQLAYMDGEPYTITGLAYGTLSSDGVDRTPYLDRLLDGVTFEMTESTQRPDGEYLILDLPESGEQLEFFLADGNYVRHVYDGEETLYQASYSSGSSDLTARVIQDWYDALAEAEGMG